jgi:hypothetical protein
VKRGMNYKATSARGRTCSAGFLMKSSNIEWSVSCGRGGCHETTPIILNDVYFV